MKKFIVAGVLAIGFFTASAQTKIGYINTDELIGVMPEAEKADAELKEYQASLAQQGQDMMKELNDKDSLFVRDSAKLSPSMKEIKKNELISLYQKVYKTGTNRLRKCISRKHRKKLLLCVPKQWKRSVQLPKKVVIAISSISTQ
jgi:Skp family chaperone for outer membrane proteins